MSKLEKFALRGGGGILDILTRTMSELEKFALWGGVSRTMSEIPCPRAESAPQALAYTHTPYHWLLAIVGPDNVRAGKICQVGGGYPRQCLRYPAPDNVRVGKICFVGGIPDNVRDTLPQG